MPSLFRKEFYLFFRNVLFLTLYFSGPAIDWAFDLKNMSTWTLLKNAMKAKFKGKMTIQMKAQLRKSLKQIQEESVQDFYNRDIPDSKTFIHFFLIDGSGS